jgi:hypothetical protein
MDRKPKPPAILRELLETKPTAPPPPGTQRLTEGEDLSALNALLARIRDQGKDQKKK